MAKLFAFEEMDANTGLDDTVEVSPEELEATQELPAVQEESEDINQHGEAIDEAVDAAGDLDDVQEVVEKSIEEEGGLSPVAAEAVRIAVESICARIGASPKTLFSLYATENYKSSSARLANSKLALEGIGDFIRDLWEKIKKAVKNLWDKIVAFWEKHISTLGQLAKALDKLYDKVGSITGNPEEREVKAPSSLGKDFKWVNKINASVIVETIRRHVAFTGKIAEFQKASSTFKETFKNVVNNFNPEHMPQYADEIGRFGNEVENLSFGSEREPLITGVFYQSEVKLEEESGEFFSTFNIKRIEVNEVEDHDLVVLAPNEMSEAVKVAKVLVLKTMEVKKEIKNAEKNLNETIESIDKLIVKTDKEFELKDQPKNTEMFKKSFRALSGIFSKFQAIYARFVGDIISLNIRAANSVIVAVNTSAKQYKKSK